ncbi:MAG: YtxH domain-containing protein [Caldilineales bacterium]
MFGSLLKLAGGLVIGAGVGIVVAGILAPKRGEELQSDIKAYLDEVRSAGAVAEAQRRAELQGKFREAKKSGPAELDINVNIKRDQ